MRRTLGSFETGFVTRATIYSLIFLANSTWAADIPVSPGNGTFSTAVAAATAGDTLILADGAYTESLTVSVDKSLNMRSFDKNAVVILD